MNHCSERTHITDTTMAKLTTTSWPKGVQQRTRKRVTSVGSKCSSDGPAASPMPEEEDSEEGGATEADIASGLH